MFDRTPAVKWLNHDLTRVRMYWEIRSRAERRDRTVCLSGAARMEEVSTRVLVLLGGVGTGLVRQREPAHDSGLGRRVFFYKERDSATVQSNGFHLEFPQFFLHDHIPLWDQARRSFHHFADGFACLWCL